MPVNFIGIGGQRCGTTWLHEVLKEHSEITTSAEKELHFFSSNYHFGVNWYQSQFQLNNNSICGEFSTSYLYDIQVPERVKNYNPEIKIILSIRNPIDRFISHHRHEVQGRRFLSDTNNPYEILNNNPAYLEYGLYFKFIRHWLKHFSKKQLLVILFDEIVKAPEDVVSKIYKHLGVDKLFIPTCLHAIINPSWLPKSGSILEGQKNIAAISRKMGLGNFINCFKKLGLKKTLDQMNMADKPNLIDIDIELNNYLKDYFKEDINNMSRFMNLNLQNIWFE